MNMDMSTKSVYMLMFEDENKYFQVWWMRFTAYAKLYGFAASVQKTRDTDIPSGDDTVINLDTMEGKKQEKAKNIIE